jgi:geranylgeranyl diphosphate synthase type II
MDPGAHIERVLDETLARMTTDPCPPRLAAAMRAAVFPGGARARPRLCHAVARALGGAGEDAAAPAAVALELLHCASLVHDDLPAFDGADLRRGRPAVHRAFGEATAILVGDALVIGAFEAAARAPARVARELVALLARASGAPHGMTAGQAWEGEPSVDLARYHRAKTAGLFEAATRAGAIAAGHDPDPWADLGRNIGEAYQIADDILDATARPEAIGKPSGRDAALGRPNATRALGLDAASARWRARVESALASIPVCPGRADLRAWVAEMLHRAPVRGGDVGSGRRANGT